MADDKQPAKGSQTQTCTRFGPAAYKTVAVAIDLVGATALNSHQIVEQALADKTVQKKLAEKLKKAGENLMAQQNAGKQVTFGTGLSTIGGAAVDVLKDPTLKKIKQTDEYQRLEKSLQLFQCAFDATPVGVFVDKNKTVLIIVGVVAALGGGVAMYHAKAGDVPAKAYSLLPQLTPFKLGAFDFEVKKFKLEPSSRTIALDAAVKGSWEGVKASFEMGVTFAEDSLLRGTGKGTLVLTLDPRTQGFASGQFEWSRDSADAAAKVSAGGDIGVKRTISSRTNLTVQLFGRYVHDDKKLSASGGVKSNVVLDQALAPDSRLTVSPSYTATRSQLRQGGGYLAPQTDHRVFVNVRLEF